MAALLSFLVLGQVQGPIKNFTDTLTEENPRTGRDEVVAIIRGDEAVAIDSGKDRQVVEITKPYVRYYTEPKRESDKSEEIRLWSDKARYDKGANRIDLTGHVRALRPDGAVLESGEATVLFAKAFECARHRGIRETSSSRCPECGAELKAKTSARLEIRRDFVMTRADARLTGEGLTTNDGMTEMTVARRGFLETQGTASRFEGLARGEDPSPGEPITQLYSDGPMKLWEDKEKELWSIRGEDGVRLDRIDSAGTATLTAPTMDIVLGRRVDPWTGKTVVERELLTAPGPVFGAAVTFADGKSFDMKADRLEWERRNFPDYKHDVVFLAGTEHCTEVRESGANAVTSRTARIEQFWGTATFEGDVDAVLAPGREGEPRTLKLKSDTMVVRSSPGGGPLRDIDATGKVVLEGLTDPKEGQNPGRAVADRFTWSVPDQRGLLERRPLVRVVQDNNTIFAPRIAIEGNSFFVLKGPAKQLHLGPAAEGQKAEYLATSEGDIVYDASGGRTRIRMRDRCQVRTSESLIWADRVDVTLAGDGKEVESMRSSGRVRIRQLKEGATLFGDAMRYEPKTESRSERMTLVGIPQTRVDAGPGVSLQERIDVYEEPSKKTGEKVKYMQLSGRNGVRILLEDRSK